MGTTTTRRKPSGKRPSPSRREILRSLAADLNVTLPTEAVCEGHASPAEIVEMWLFDRPDMSLVQGPRGGGKSFMRALTSQMESIWYPSLGTCILGGSLAQSEQIYGALRNFNRSTHDANLFDGFTKRSATYCTGSEVSILAASQTSVRGPHVATLCLDEVDEIDPDIRESAYGMSMELGGVSASIAMTSTWHRLAGPMAELIAKGRAGAFPVKVFCIFEVLERCPDARSGRHLEHCPACPLQPWCHSDLGSHPSGLPKAKRSNGHYAIDSFIQKVRITSLRVLESDYLCLRPKSDGVWFKDYDDATHLTTEAEYRPDFPIHVSTDIGVHTGAVLLQHFEHQGRQMVHVFDDHYSFDMGAEWSATAIKAQAESRVGTVRRHRTSMDSSGGARNPMGSTVLGEYERVGLVGSKGIEFWPKYPGSVQQSLQFLESFVKAGDGRIWIKIHPRCQHLADAFKSYVRRKVDNQWTDEPEDPQHPHEELIDALRGALITIFPEAHRPQPQFIRVPAQHVF